MSIHAIIKTSKENNLWLIYRTYKNIYILTIHNNSDYRKVTVENVVKELACHTTVLSGYVRETWQTMNLVGEYIIKLRFGDNIVLLIETSKEMKMMMNELNVENTKVS